MATLISPGVSVTVTDESFYIPASASTVPLILMATAEGKMQPNGEAAAIGTNEYHRIRTVTSLTQSIQLYGNPRFLRTSNGEPMHGDARNEYGLFTLNHFLGVGNRAYVVRANVNLNDNYADIASTWTDRVDQAAINLETMVQAWLDEQNSSQGLVPSDGDYKETINRSNLQSLIEATLEDVFKGYNFSSSAFKDKFMLEQNPGLTIYDSEFSMASVDTFEGVIGRLFAWETAMEGAAEPGEFTATEARDVLVELADDFSLTVEFLNSTTLGSDNASRRAAIVQALQATANMPDLRAEAYEFNLVMCPGYHEVTDELIALATDLSEEALVIGDVPMDLDPSEAVEWAESSAGGRQFNNSVFYYYAHGIGSNLDGNNVLVPSSTIALRTITQSDNVSQVWFAPAGSQRGVVTGISQVGYYTGTPGTATTFVETVLNQGMRDDLYKTGTNINPITFLPGRGIIVMGQKTSASVASALDRINVVRLLAHIRRALRKNTFAFIFEPNDSLTRGNLKSMVDGFLSDLVVKRGLYDYASQCDEINNTPDRIDRGELYVDIALKPVKAAEFIYIPIRVLSTGADL